MNLFFGDLFHPPVCDICFALQIQPLRQLVEYTLSICARCAPLPCKSLQLIMIATKCTKGATDALLFHNSTAVQFYDEKCSAMRSSTVQWDPMQCSATTDALLFHRVHRSAILWWKVQMQSLQCNEMQCDAVQCNNWCTAFSQLYCSAILRWAVQLFWYDAMYNVVQLLPHPTIQCNYKMKQCNCSEMKCTTWNDAMQC